jgi:hypothetical protein
MQEVITGSLTPLRENSGANFGMMYVNRNVVTPMANTSITPGYAIADLTLL